MNAVATSPDQVIPQVHQLSLASPRHENPNRLALTQDNLASSAIVDARSDLTSMNSSLLPDVPYLASSITGTFTVSLLPRNIEGRTRPPGAITQYHSLEDLPNELLFHIMGFLDVNDLLSTSRVSNNCLLLERTRSTLWRRIGNTVHAA